MKTNVIYMALCAVIVGGTLFGYYGNVVKLIELDFQAPYKAEISRVLGLVPPLGFVMGYVEFEEEKEQ